MTIPVKGPTKKHKILPKPKFSFREFFMNIFGDSMTCGFCNSRDLKDISDTCLGATTKCKNCGAEFYTTYC